MAKGVRKNITIPGLLAPTLRLRSTEMGFRNLSPFISDLVLYDLQSGAEHTITLAVFQDTQSAQDAVDAELVARYQPGQPREGLLVQLVERLAEVRALARSSATIPLNSKPVRITFPAQIWQLVDLRWVELGYDSLSAYITGLIRYDLLISGPHRRLMPISGRAAQDAVARETVARRKGGHRRKLYLDHLLERVEGRVLNKTELDELKARMAQHLRTVVLFS
jgi:hypothetical protein